MNFDFEKVAKAIRDVADTEILPRWQHLKAGEITQKTGPDDIVTIADGAAEKALGHRLLQLYPETEVVGEEGVTADTARMKLFNGEKPVWVIDPIDGTMAFSKGGACFDIMMALVKGRELLGGWIYGPVERRMIMGGKGTGVFRCQMTEDRGQEKRERLPSARAGVPLKELTGILGKKFFPEEMRKKLFGKTGDFKKLINTLCAGHDYARLLRGEADFSIYNKTMPWDHLPGLALAAELGYFYAKWDGTPYLPGDHKGGLLIAPDKDSWEKINGLLLKQ